MIEAVLAWAAIGRGISKGADANVMRRNIIRPFLSLGSLDRVVGTVLHQLSICQHFRTHVTTCLLTRKR